MKTTKMVTIITKSLISVGNSLAITIPSDIVKLLDLNEGDYLKIMIEPYELPIKSYRCCACQSQFDSDDKEPYCPSCKDSPKIEEIKNGS